jgi:hypothetical protein
MQTTNRPLTPQPEETAAPLPHGVNASGGIAHTVEKGALAVLDSVPIVVSGSTIGILKNPA